MMLSELERMMCLILSLGDALSKKEDILSLPTGKQLEFAAQYLLANGVILPPCKVGDCVRFAADDRVWRVDAVHFYREGSLQISITHGNVTETITGNTYIDRIAGKWGETNENS